MRRSFFFVALALLFYGDIPVFAEDLRHTISVSGGFMEAIDVEYQYAFSPYYIAFKPGFLVMWICAAQDRGLTAYPSIRFGWDAMTVRAFHFGLQTETSFFYSGRKALNYLDYLMRGGEWSTTDYWYLGLAPAIRYATHRFEFQAAFGGQLEFSIRYRKTNSGDKTIVDYSISKTDFLPMVRLSAGIKL
jgi:hypothetical protein